MSDLAVNHYFLDAIVQRHPALATEEGRAALSEVVELMRESNRAAVVAKLQSQMTKAFKVELDQFDESDWPVFSKEMVRAATVSAHQLALELVEHFGRGEDVGPPEETPDPDPVSVQGVGKA